MENNNSNWIWTKEWDNQCKDKPVFVLFRKKIILENEPQNTKFEISADSRYKLYINERFVEAGPAKGDSKVWYKDTVNIKTYLKKGVNIIAVIVLRFPYDSYIGNQSIMTTMIPGLYINGEITDAAGQILQITGDDTWECKIDLSREIVPEANEFAPLHIYEKVHLDADIYGWMQAEFQNDLWKPAVPYPKGQIRPADSPGNLEDRRIPFMRRKKGRFKEVLRVEGAEQNLASWTAFIRGNGSVIIPPHSHVSAELHAGEEMTAYYSLFLKKGTHSKITILQSESYVKNELSQDGMPKKEDRMDYLNGHLEGFQDIYYPLGNANEREVYSPFWFRTFRFVKLTIQTEEESLILEDIEYEETGYPLDIKTSISTSDPTLEQIWDMSQRTLQRCMHETYEDCPFYEQLQYAMDSRAEMLFTYNAAADDRLARQCLDDFCRSQRYDGLLYSAYPNKKPNVIPTFSIFYILMLHDHMMYFGDKELIRDHMPAVERILRFFEKHIGEKGLVLKTGDRHGEGKFWSFIDWVPEWKGGGVPNAIVNGSITIESLYYILGLMRASELASYIGKKEQAEEYLMSADCVRHSVRNLCIGKNGMIQDGPGIEEYSQHCQVIGILTDTLLQEEGKSALQRTLDHKESYAQCTVSNALYLFEALAKTGLYQRTNECWDIWRKMRKNHMTTCAEAESYARSDCHAWGAIALYEMPAVILGVKPAAPGYAKVNICPTPGYLTYAKGEVITPRGRIFVEWKKEDKQITIHYSVPEDVVADVAVHIRGEECTSGYGQRQKGKTVSEEIFEYRLK